MFIHFQLYNAKLSAEYSVHKINRLPYLINFDGIIQIDIPLQKYYLSTSNIHLKNNISISESLKLNYFKPKAGNNRQPNKTTKTQGPVSKYFRL